MMDSIINFASNHYLALIIITLILIFALIGYFVAQKEKKASPFKIATENNNDLNIENIQVTNNVSLQQAIKDGATVKNNHDDAPML